MNLKTLKETVAPLGDVDYSFTWEKQLIEAGKLKTEAIKWVKHRREQGVPMSEWDFITFNNIIEEDLK